jgi:DNA-binding transcriptional regulator GbsR (MarR family)
LRYDRNVLEKANVPNLTNDEHRFIEDMGQTMAGWGIPRSTGRIYGYLLLRAEPAGLDQIAGDLGVGKSGVSVGARQLVSLGLARSSGERRSRRVLYEALHTLESIFAARNAQANDLLARLRQGARAATMQASREHLQEMADLMQDFMDQGPELLRMLRDQRRRLS